MEKNPAAAFFSVGETYVNMAFDEPKSDPLSADDSKGLVNLGGIGLYLTRRRTNLSGKHFAVLWGSARGESQEFMNTVVIYTQGLVTFII